jgi:hypothetical protein
MCAIISDDMEEQQHDFEDESEVGERTRRASAPMV